MPIRTLQEKKSAKAAGGKPNALQQALRPSEELAAVVGKIWDYIKSNNL